MNTSLPKTSVVAVLGGGSFGTALADVAARNGHAVRQWMRSPEQVEEINRDHTNSRYMPGCVVHESVHGTSDLHEAICDASLIIVAIPSQALRSVVTLLKDQVAGRMVISTSKGIEAGTFSLMSEILRQELPDALIGALSGPNLAREIMERCTTATVIASESREVCQHVRHVFHSDCFRVYSSRDRFGVELGGALKNIYAIVTGLATSQGAGENTRSMLITRGLAEMSRFAAMMGANPMTFLGLAGVGDLIVTCESRLSRNFRVGYAMGQGQTLAQIEQELGQVAEGVNTLPVVRARARERGVSMPIVEGLYSIVVEGEDVGLVTSSIMTGEQEADVEFIAS